MSSQRKIDSCRANGAKSRGPKTVAGREKSSMNALRHGLTAETILLANESPERFKYVRDSYIEQFHPVGEVELDLVEEMVVAKWRQRRNQTIEAALLNREMEQQDEPDEINRLATAFVSLAENSNALALLTRYEPRLQRDYHRALKSLLNLQAIRKKENDTRQTNPIPQMNALHLVKTPVASAQSRATNPQSPATSHQPPATVTPPRVLVGVVPCAEVKR